TLPCRSSSSTSREPCGSASGRRWGTAGMRAVTSAVWSRSTRNRDAGAGATLLRRLLDIDERRQLVGGDPDLLSDVGAARPRHGIDRHRAAEPRRGLDRLEDADVGQAFPPARLGIEVLANAPGEVLDLGG